MLEPRTRTPRHVRHSFGALLFLTSLVLLAACSSSAKKADSQPFQIGAILPLTGALSSYGETSNAALAEAVSAINGKGGSQIDLIVADSGSVPATALQKLKDLHDRGVKVVIGPYSSAEVAAVKDFADANGMLILSPLSTASSLAIAGDNILRFTPDDDAEGAALANLAWADGIRTLIPVTRDDEGNRGLQTSVKRSFEALGGTVVSGIAYGVNETDFSDEARQLNGILTALTTPTAQTGIYLTAFAEVTGVLGAASDFAALGGVKWYGSDSVALSKDLTQDSRAAHFAIAADYPNPILGLREEDRGQWSPVSDRIQQKLGRVPDAFALAAYDALMTADAAMSAAGGSDASRLKTEAIAYANRSTGLTGPLQLNDAGDRARGSYDFWDVCAQPNGFSWRKAASYTPGSQAARVNPLPAC